MGTIPQMLRPEELIGLESFFELADTWTIYTDASHIHQPVRCIRCAQVLWFSRDAGGNDTPHTDEELIAWTSYHIREMHREMTRGSRE